MAEKVRVRIIVSGLVQRVFFRSSTVEKAKEFGVCGWVKNLPDGRVEAVFEGDRQNVEKAVEWAKKGPPRAQVDGFEVNWQEYQGEFNNFKIKYD